MGPGGIAMSTYADDVRIRGPGPAPASEDTDTSLSGASAAETGQSAAGTDHSDCPYCGDAGRDQVRRYRFCGHDTP